MDDNSSLTPSENRTTGGTASSSSISIVDELKNRFKVKDCSIKLEIVDPETIKMATTEGDAMDVAEDKQDGFSERNEQEKDDVKPGEQSPVVEDVTATTAVVPEIKSEPVEETAIQSKVPTSNAANGSTAEPAPSRSTRKRPRKSDPAAKPRDFTARPKESSVRVRPPSTSKPPSRLKKPKRRYDGYLDDASAPSENLFSEINWEENLDCDTSALVDEFAPRPTKPIVKTKSSELKKVETPTVAPTVVEVVEPSPSDLPLTAQEFRPGTKVNVLDYKTSTWNEGAVTEVDWEENEVLIVYDDRKEEWVSMSSQRLSRCALAAYESKDDSFLHSNDSALPHGENPVTVSTPKRDSSSRARPGGSLSARKRARVRSSGSVGGSSPSQRDRKRKRPSLQSPSGKPTPSGFVFGQDGPMSDGKFQVGEKVLAKWSDFRMQKFPAIIKKIVGSGSYDLLFYDGFEKTIRAENVFKTTEEEVARYKQTNPSEADVFVDIDADSKEARRQRKKKSFGDSFLSGTDFPKKRFPGGSPQTPQPMTPTRPDPITASSASKQIEQPVLTQSSSSIRRSRNSRRSHEEALLLAEEMVESAPPSREPLKIEEPPKVKERVFDKERFLGDIPEGARPLKLPLPDSDLFQISVIMPDKRLPPDWVKHCIKCDGAWKAFLLSPDRFKITNRAELAEYAQKVLKIKSPKRISFQFLEEIIPELVLKQKDMEPSEDFQNWIRRKSIKKPKQPPASVVQPVEGHELGQNTLESSASTVSPKSGGVKTLLPKHRSPVATSPVQAGQAVPDESDATGLLKCIKEGCDKKFRKESLLHMHLKHYHVEEFKKILMMAPRVDELASARTESGFKGDSPVKPSPSVVKKPTPKLSPQASELAKTDHPAPLPPVTHTTPEEKKITIKTLLPRRSTSQDLTHQSSAEAMDVDSVIEDEFAGYPQKIRAKKPKLEPPVGSALSELGYPMGSTLRQQKKKLSSIEKTESAEEGKASPNYEVTDDGVLIERLRSEELINCVCGFREEDGLMIQCDICMCWQHGICSGMMTDSDVPERYVCYICRNPPKVRSSQKYSYALHYLTQGKLANFTFRKKDENDLREKEAIVKKCYDILGSLHNMHNVECSLRAKLNVAQRSDHPKLYLWAKNWETQTKKESEPNPEGSRVPVPEAPIDLDECRSRLLDHIDSYIEQLDTRLNTIHSQLLVLDSQDHNSETADSDKLTKQVLHTINKDLITVKKIAKLD